MPPDRDAVELDPYQDDPASASSSPDAPLISPTNTQPTPKWLRSSTTASTSTSPSTPSSSTLSRFKSIACTSVTAISQWVRRLAVWLRNSSWFRPRLTWRYILCATAALYTTYCFLRGSPLLASRLPKYSGPYAVGAIDVEVPLEKPQRISDTLFRDSRKPAFELETTLFTLYYPADRSAKATRPHHYWIPKPISLTAEGYASFAHINNFIVRPMVTFALWAIAGGIRIPSMVDAPLAQYYHGDSDDESSHDQKAPKFPIMVFSHGMASSRHDYTHYLGELASRGIVVAAVEHRDGSCPGTMIKQAGKKDRKLITFRESDLITNITSADDKGDKQPSEQPIETLQLKKEQLAVRDAEIFETIKVLAAIDGGQGTTIYESNSRKEGTTLEAWTHRLDMGHLAIGGHSYGATGALQALKHAPNVTPAIGGIMLDPGKESGPLNTEVDVPILVVHSNSWSSKHSIFFGRPHFDAVREIVVDTLKRTSAAWFLTSLGTSHPSVTDAPLIEPWLLSWTTGARMNTKEGLREYVKISADFFHFLTKHKKTGILKEKVTHESFNKWVSEERKDEFPKALARLWEVHVSPVN